MSEKRRLTAIGNQAKARAAVRRALDRHKLYIVHKRYFDGIMSARVLIDGDYYDVNERELALLEAGRRPRQDLALDPVQGDAD